MTKKLSVSLSGPALSLLLYENSKSKYEQEGFLIGDIIERRNTTITDTDHKQENIETKIHVNSLIPCHCIGYFYNGMGILDDEKLNNYLQSLSTKVIAWYKYRPKMANFKFTIRDKIIHKQLARYFNIPIMNFTCCILISHCNNVENESTYSFTQNFIRFNELYGSWDNIPLHITNLDDPHHTYKTPEPVSETFNKIIKDLKIDFNKGHSVDIILKIQHAMQKHIETVVDSLSEADKRVFDLENEIKTLLKQKSVGEKNIGNLNGKNTKSIKKKSHNLRTNNEKKVDEANHLVKRL